MQFFDDAMIWHVVFHPSDGEWWAGRFRHVSLAGYSDDTWMHLHVTRNGVSAATIYRFDEVTDFLSVLLTHFTVVKFGPSLKRSRQFLMPMSCVSFVKHTLGIRGSALRPDGLFRILTQEYSVEVLSETENTSRKPRATA